MKNIISNNLDQDNENIWDAYWQHQWQLPEQDEAMNYFLSIILEKNYRLSKNKTIESALELGGGSGRASRYLNNMGAETGILDNSTEAIAYCKYINQDVPHPVTFYEYDLFDIDYNKIKKDYNLCWNAGVIEHFSPDLQLKMIEVMGNIIDFDGMIVIFTPYSRCVFYRIGKWILEKLNRFPYGDEIPTKSLKHVIPSNMRLIEKEISVGFVILLFNGFKALSYLPQLGKIGIQLNQLINYFFYFCLSKQISRDIILGFDFLLSKIFGGYLLMTSIEKVKSNS